MPAQSPPDTRAEILRVALEEFALHGYHATSVRAIAQRVGVTKTAVLYHYPEKADILAALAKPMLDDVDRVMSAAQAQTAAAARWAVIEGLLDVWLAHRHLLRLNLQDLALAAAQPVFDRYRDLMLQGIELIAGRRASFADRVRAAQALAMLGDPVVLFAHMPLRALREEVLRGARRLLGTPPAKSTGRKRGRPGALTAQRAEKLRQLHEAGRSADEIAQALGVSRATAYRALRRLDIETL
jgi:AcrR family transcriptional regulator